MFRRLITRGATGYYSPHRVGARLVRRIIRAVIGLIFLAVIVGYFLLTNR
jgi:hypothetical protein